MGSWWEAYQEMSNDEKEAAISQYNRQKARNRRKAVAEPVENNKVETEIEPLVDIPEPRSRRGKKNVLDKNNRWVVSLKSLCFRSWGDERPSDFEA